MKSTIQTPQSLEELNEALTALKLKIALQEYQSETIEAILSEPDDPSAHEHLAHTEQPTLRRMNRRMRRRNIQRLVSKTLPKASKMTACLLLVFYIGLTAAVATVESVRVGLQNFFVHFEKTHVEIGFEKTDNPVDVPSEWDGYYYPSYIPEGFTLNGVYTDTVLYQKATENGTDELCFGDHTSDTRITLDSENAAIDSIIINGMTATIIEKAPWTTVFWSLGNRCIIVEFTGSRDETIRIAESVVILK